MGMVHPALWLPAPLAVGITPRSAHLLALLFTSSYVGSLYLAQNIFLDRPSRASDVPVSQTTTATTSPAPISAGSGDPNRPEVGSRDHPETIKIRMKAVMGATAASLAGVLWTVKNVGSYSWLGAIKPALSLLGLHSAITIPTVQAFTPYLLAPALMFGPVVANYLDGDLPFQRPDSGGLVGRIKKTWSSWTLVDTRNFVVGPLTEELVFRSTILAVSIMGGLSTKNLVFGTPLWFGIAHAHHAWDAFRRNGGDSDAAKRAVATSVFQLGYTTLFGWFAAYLYLRTGSVIAPAVSHIFCNYMGIYLPTTAARRHPKKSLILWSSYVLGIAAFVVGLRRL